MPADAVARVALRNNSPTIGLLKNCLMPLAFLFFLAMTTHAAPD